MRNHPPLNIIRTTLPRMHQRRIRTTVTGGEGSYSHRENDMANSKEGEDHPRWWVLHVDGWLWWSSGVLPSCLEWTPSSLLSFEGGCISCFLEVTMRVVSGWVVLSTFSQKKKEKHSHSTEQEENRAQYEERTTQRESITQNSEKGRPTTLKERCREKGDHKPLFEIGKRSTAKERNPLSLHKGETTHHPT